MMSESDGKPAVPAKAEEVRQALEIYLSSKSLNPVLLSTLCDSC